MKKLIVSFMVLTAVVFGGVVGYAAENGLPVVNSTEISAGEMLTAEGIGYYRVLPNDGNVLEFELNEVLTDFGQVVTPKNFKGVSKDINPRGVELIERLLATNNYKGYILTHRTLHLIKYRSESWDELVKEFKDIYSKLK